jgi:voltage-gated potassium channel
MNDSTRPPAVRSGQRPWQHRLYEIVFESDTPAGKAFDVTLLGLIVLSVLVVMLDSIPSLSAVWHGRLRTAELIFTGLFTLEYLLRLICVRSPLGYARSFYGLIDLIAILPAYVGLFIGNTHFLIVVRILRLLRVFRVFKLAQHLDESQRLLRALSASGRKISVFLFFLMLLITVLGSMMYVVESPVNEGFRSIPESIYWAVVTLTTVGYGDITPVTPLGKAFATVIMLLGYAIIAVPTGLVTAELAKAKDEHQLTTQTCPNCLRQGHDTDATHCKYCGAAL